MPRWRLTLERSISGFAAYDPSLSIPIARTFSLQWSLRAHAHEVNPIVYVRLAGLRPEKPRVLDCSNRCGASTRDDVNSPRLSWMDARRRRRDADFCIAFDGRTEPMCTVIGCLRTRRVTSRASGHPGRVLARNIGFVRRVVDCDASVSAPREIPSEGLDD